MDLHGLAPFQATFENVYALALYDCDLLQNKVTISGRELSELRYGENPHQKAKLYEITAPQLAKFDYVQLSGKALSFNNLVDTESAFSCVEQFNSPSCVIVKHANPCGVATAKTLEDAYKSAYKTDPTSAFGGIITFNKKIKPQSQFLSWLC